MTRLCNIFISVLILPTLLIGASAQMARNPKISPQDLEAAQAEARESGLQAGREWIGRNMPANR